MQRLLLIVTLALVLLTRPDGSAIWVNDAMVVAVRAALPGEVCCTAVVTLNGTFSVRESPEQTARALGPLKEPQWNASRPATSTSSTR